MIRVSIPDMTCSHCRAAVVTVLTSVPGVAAVDVDLENRSALIEGEVSSPALLAALDQAGYPSVLAG